MLYTKSIAEIIKPFLRQYLKFTTSFRYKNLRLKVYKDVFHPSFFFSSKYLASFIEGLDLEGRSFCEPCSGSGILSLVAYAKKANVTCFDINEVAVENIKHNFKSNFDNEVGHKFSVIQSNMFVNVPIQKFDYIVINPPYFFKKQNSVWSLAWNCGENGEVFELFFSQVKNYMHEQSKCYMNLAETCEIDLIKEIAKKYDLTFHLTDQRKIHWEINYIFEVKPVN